jgi:hypothetical protein
MGNASYDVIGQVARFRLTGEHDLEDGVRRITDAIVLTKERGLDKLLVDITTITGVAAPAGGARVWVVGPWARAGRGSVRFALVTRPEFIAPDRFGIILGMSRGFIANIFESEARALEWLQRAGPRS